jgi:hypothetical protein
MESDLERVEPLLELTVENKVRTERSVYDPLITNLQLVLNALISSLNFSNLSGLSLAWTVSDCSGGMTSSRSPVRVPLRAIIKNVVRSKSTTSTALQIPANVVRCCESRGAFGMRE